MALLLRELRELSAPSMHKVHDPLYLRAPPLLRAQELNLVRRQDRIFLPVRLRLRRKHKHRLKHRTRSITTTTTCTTITTTTRPRRLSRVGR